MGEKDAEAWGQPEEGLVPRIAEEGGAETVIGQGWAAPHPDQDLLSIVHAFLCLLLKLNCTSGP